MARQGRAKSTSRGGSARAHRTTAGKMTTHGRTMRTHATSRTASARAAGTSRTRTPRAAAATRKGMTHSATSRARSVARQAQNVVGATVGGVAIGVAGTLGFITSLLDEVSGNFSVLTSQAVNRIYERMEQLRQQAEEGSATAEMAYERIVGLARSAAEQGQQRAIELLRKLGIELESEELIEEEDYIEHEIEV